MSAFSFKFAVQQEYSPNKPVKSGKTMSLCLLQKTQTPRQHNFVPYQGRYNSIFGVNLYE